MANIRMLQARREAVEKEKLKEQGTLKAQRSQEVDTQDVAKKTNVDESSRTAKKAKRDAFLAQSEIELADKKIANATLGAAVGAIAAAASAIGAFIPKKSEGDKADDKAKKAENKATDARKEANTDKKNLDEAKKKNSPDVEKLQDKANKSDAKATNLEGRATELKAVAKEAYKKEGKDEKGQKVDKPSKTEPTAETPPKTENKPVPGVPTETTTSTGAKIEPTAETPPKTENKPVPGVSTETTTSTGAKIEPPAEIPKLASDNPNSGKEKATLSVIKVDGKDSINLNDQNSKNQQSSAFGRSSAIFGIIGENLADGAYDRQHHLDSSQPGSATFARKQERLEQRGTSQSARTDSQLSLEEARGKAAGGKISDSELQKALKEFRGDKPQDGKPQVSLAGSGAVKEGEQAPSGFLGKKFSERDARVNAFADQKFGLGDSVKKTEFINALKSTGGDVDKAIDNADKAKYGNKINGSDKDLIKATNTFERSRGDIGAGFEKNADRSQNLAQGLSSAFSDHAATEAVPGVNGNAGTAATPASNKGTDFSNKYLITDANGVTVLKGTGTLGAIGGFLGIGSADQGNAENSALRRDILDGTISKADAATIINQLGQNGGAKAAGELIASIGGPLAKEILNVGADGKPATAEVKNPDGTVKTPANNPIIGANTIAAIASKSNLDVSAALTRGVEGRSDATDLKTQIGGSKVTPEKASTFNSTLLIFNIGIPALQFFLQQLDKIREAQDAKNEAIKKLAGANKLLAALGQELKRQGSINSDSHASTPK